MSFYTQVRDLKALLQHDEEEICQEGGKKVTFGDELLKAEKEAEKLRTQNSTLTRKGQHQHEEIRRLNKVSP